MTDLLAINSETQRRIVVGALLVYVALFLINLLTGNRLASAGADLLIGALVLAASVVGYRRVTRSSADEPVVLAIISVLSIAGLSSIYQGLTTLDLVRPLPIFEAVGSIALLVAVVLYVYQQRS
ncbi:hypothetical protein BRC91_08490 [Halobacteriales archaeon QS_4_62_28]|nr:MAG: hypothetical protein BRC91_08490 [Halobacteriales archaeon QS_4_62_28]